MVIGTFRGFIPASRPDLVAELASLLGVVNVRLVIRTALTASISDVQENTPSVCWRSDNRVELLEYAVCA